MYTVKQLSDLAQISVRALHYYDEIDLLKPSQVGANGYRYYDDASLLRLQQILFYREIGLELVQIRDVLDSPDFDLLAALRSHREVLVQKGNRLQNLIATIDSTMMHLAGEMDMSKKRLFEGFSEAKQKDYEREARLQYGPDKVNESIQRWGSYSEQQREAIQIEGGDIYTDLAKAMNAGIAPQSPEVQDILVRWHQHIRYFYEPTLEILRGLAEGYNTHPDFIAFFDRVQVGLAPYLQEAILQYVDDLESAEIERMLAEDDQYHHLQG